MEKETIEVCSLCEGPLRTGTPTRASLDQQTGVCAECRQKAFGFDNRLEQRGLPLHTEMKDRHCLPSDVLMGPAREPYGDDIRPYPKVR